MAEVAHGVELKAEAIDPWLLNKERFKLFQTDITKFKFERNYDLIVYNSVHHHVIGKFGKRMATETWHNIVDHCNKYLIFETGLLSESGDFYWKEGLMELFGTDKLYVKSLLNSLGPRLDKVKTIKNLTIHGTKRPLFKLVLHQIGSSYDLKKNTKEFFGQMYSTDIVYQIVMEWQRTIGSQSQELVNVSDPAAKSKKLWDETDFYLLRKDNSQELFFAKKIHDPYNEMREFVIHKNIDHPKVLRPIEVSVKYGLVFPFLNWEPLPKIDFSNIEGKEQLANEIKAFYNFAFGQRVDLGSLNPRKSWRNPCLIDIVDLNTNNFMVLVNGNKIVDWRVIDMEYYFNNTRRRNAKHKKNILDLIYKANTQESLKR